MKHPLLTALILVFCVATYGKIVGAALQPPKFIAVTPATNLCGSAIRVSFTNSNPSSQTEVYRSNTSSGVFTLVNTLTGNEYIDQDVPPRRSYFYKLRAVSSTDVSAYSSVHEYVSGSDFFTPDFYTNYPENGDVTKAIVYLHDYSYADVSYAVSRQDHVTNEVTLIQTISDLDSGNVYTITDTSIVIGRVYHYWVDASINCEGNEQVMERVAELDVYPDLYIPTLEPYRSETCGNVAIMEIYGLPDGSHAEVLRARSEAGPYTMVSSYQLAGEYKEDNLESNVYYYYKIRAVLGEAHSDFTPVLGIQTGHALYLPILTTRFLPDHTLELKFTDRSEQDFAYHIYGKDLDTGYTTYDDEGGFGADSGRTYLFYDTLVAPGKTYVYTVDVTSFCWGFTDYWGIVRDTVTIENTGVGLYPPTLSYYHDKVCGNQVIFTINNTVPGAKREVYRATSEAGPFELVNNDAPVDFIDENLLSNVNYYYKVRVALNGEYSDFTAVRKVRSGHALYTPEITTRFLPDHTVELKFTVLSKQEAIYEIYGKDLSTGLPTVRIPFTLYYPDSGSTYLFYDTLVTTGKSYAYTVDVTSYCIYTVYKNVTGDTLVTDPPDKNVVTNEANDQLKEAEAVPVSVMLYPNPVNKTSRIEITSPTQSNVYYEIIDVRGITQGSNVETPAAANTGENKKIVNMPDLVTGVYILRVTVGQERFFKRFVVE